jgi:ankyrin
MFFLYTYVQVASVLLEHGASLTATTKKGFTPLHLAAKYGNLNVAKLLLQKDAPVDAQGKVCSWHYICE